MSCFYILKINSLSVTSLQIFSSILRVVFLFYGILCCANGRRQWHPTPVLLPRKSHGCFSSEKELRRILIPFLSNFLSLGLCLETFLWGLEVLGGNVMEITTTVCLFSKHSTASRCAQYWGDNGNQQKADMPTSSWNRPSITSWNILL